MWIDATVAASFVTNPNDSTVADHVGFALAPNAEGVEKRSNWLWAWALAIPAGTQQEGAAKQFIEWATSKDYIELVAENEGWANVPPGARTSLYETPEYQDVPFASDAGFAECAQHSTGVCRRVAVCPGHQLPWPSIQGLSRNWHGVVRRFVLPPYAGLESMEERGKAQHRGQGTWKSLVPRSRGSRKRGRRSACVFFPTDVSVPGPPPRGFGAASPRARCYSPMRPRRHLDADLPPYSS